MSSEMQAGLRKICILPVFKEITFWGAKGELNICSTVKTLHKKSRVLAECPRSPLALPPAPSLPEELTRTRVGTSPFLSPFSSAALRSCVPSCTFSEERGKTQLQPLCCRELRHPPLLDDAFRHRAKNSDFK